MVTIVIPVSRPDFLKRVFTQLELLDCNREDTNILCYIDGDMRLFEVARNLTEKSKFAKRLAVYRNRGVANVSSFKRRRIRIAEIHNELKKYIYSAKYLFLIEDDTIVRTDALKKMLDLYSVYPHAGFISGVQLGRWGFTTAGIWKVKNNPYDIQSIESVMPGQGVEEIDAAGLYCCLTKFDVYKKFDFKPYDDILGPDVAYGIWLRQQGYKNYVDWSITTRHLTKQGEITLSNTKVQQIKFVKQGENWDQTIYDTINTI